MPMRRRLFKFSVALSLLVCVLILLSWVPSYWIGFRASRYRPSNSQELRIAQGQLSFQWMNSVAKPATPSIEDYGFTNAAYVLPHHPWGNPKSQLRFPGLWAYSWVNPKVGTTQSGFVVQNWLLAALTALPAIYIPISNRARRRQRRSEGLCPRCGYSLAGNTSGVCPECGTPVLRKTNPASSSAALSGVPAP